MLRWVLAALAVAVASPLAAQDGSEAAGERTVESAQKFLSEYYASLRGQVTTFDLAYEVGGRWQLGPEPTGWTSRQSVEPLLVELLPLDRCRMTAKVEKLLTYTPFAYEDGPPLRNSPAALTATVDFSQVTTVDVKPFQKRFRRSGEMVPAGWIIYVEGKGGMSLIHKDEESAKRAAFAIDFLKRECGFKTDSGF